MSEEGIVKRATPEAIRELLTVDKSSFVYQFSAEGRIVRGISWIGAKALAEYFRISIVDADIKEIDMGFFGKAKAEWNGRVAYGGAYQPKMMKVKDGREVPDPKAAVKALNKAQRNAILNLLPIPKYIVTEISGVESPIAEEKAMAGKETQTWEVPSERDPNTSYIVKRAGDKWSCSCPNFLFRGEECKHIKKIKEETQGGKGKGEEQ
jgi:hypothetical protein